MLFRILLAATTAGLAALSADTVITVGGPDGLTSAYVNGGCVAPNGPDFDGCEPGSTGGYSQVTELATSVSYWQAPATGGTLTVPVGEYGQWWVSILDNNDSWNAPGGVNAFVELDFGTSSSLANAGSIVYPLVNGVNIQDVQTSFGATVLSVDAVHRSYYLVDVQVVDLGGGTGVAGIATGTPEPGSASTLGIGLVLLLAGGKLANRGRTPEGCHRAGESLRGRT